MNKRIIEVFTAGCPCCDDAVQIVRDTACESCDVRILDMRTDQAAQAKAKEYGIHRVPAVVVDGQLADCCQGGRVEAARLRAMGVGNAV